MAKKEEFAERLARIETKMERCEIDISHIETRNEEFKKEAREYVDQRGKELFDMCLREHGNKVGDRKKSSSVVTLQRWQLIVAIVVFVVLVVGLILQGIGIL